MINLRSYVAAQALINDPFSFTENVPIHILFNHSVNLIMIFIFSFMQFALIETEQYPKGESWSDQCFGCTRKIFFLPFLPLQQGKKIIFKV